MKNFYSIILIVLAANCYSQTNLKIELIDKCASRVWIKEYIPQNFTDESKPPITITNQIRNEFKEKFGAKYNQISFTVGFEYDLKFLKSDHKNITKDYNWEIPKYILNYAFYDDKSGIIYCMNFSISESGKVIQDFIPKINEKFQNLDFISKEEAIKYIKTRKIKKRKLKNIDLENGRLIYNSKSEVFEWEFGKIKLICVEAIPNGKIRFSKFKGIIEL